jgi:hypothetical protein
MNEDFSLKTKEQLLQDFEEAKNILRNISTRAREIVDDKSIPLDTRWELWCNCVEKAHERWYFNNKEYPLLSKKIKWGMENADYPRYSTITYENIIDSCDEDFLNDFKEEIISANFGSCQIDW